MKVSLVRRETITFQITKYNCVSESWTGATKVDVTAKSVTPWNDAADNFLSQQLREFLATKTLAQSSLVLSFSSYENRTSHSVESNLMVKSNYEPLLKELGQMLRVNLWISYELEDPVKLENIKSGGELPRWYKNVDSRKKSYSSKVSRWPDCVTMKMPRTWRDTVPGANPVEFQTKLTVVISVDQSDCDVLYAMDVRNVTKQILQGGMGTDTSIITASGDTVKCHSAFLTVQSPALRAMLEGDLCESQTRRILLDTMTTEGVKAMLAYLYHRELDGNKMTQSVAVQLLKAGNKYLISDLEHGANNILLDKPAEWYDVEETLNLFFFTNKLDQCHKLKLRCLEILKLRSNEVTNCAAYRNLFLEAAAAQELTNALLNSQEEGIPLSQ